MTVKLNRRAFVVTATAAASTLAMARAGMAGGHTVHVGTDDAYVALYSPGAPNANDGSNYTTVGGLNHIAVTVDDLDAAEEAIKAHGFETGNHGDYEPGRRFYFHDQDGIEYEVVQYD